MKFAVFAVVVAAVASGQTTADRESIAAFYGQWSRDSATRGAEGYAAHFAEDATLLPPNHGPVTGRDAIRAYQAKQRTDATFTLQVEKLAVDEITILSPGVAAYRSTLTGKRVPKDGGPAVPFEAKYFDILQKTADGKWQFRFRMWSDNTAVPAK
jgi:uncharacterized protein (TIGR02246 family)